MNELVEDLEDKRARHNAEAERRKRTRDELNDKTRHWVETRDRLNASVRELIDQANAQRDIRDTLNAEVKEAKARRDEWNSKFNELSDKVIILKREKMPKSGIPLRKLKAELRALEKKHMTSVLSADKERTLVDQISELSSRIQAMERELEQFSEIKQAEKEARDAKDSAERFHHKVSELAEKAQTAHDSMLKLYEEADRLRKDADEAQEKFIETKLAADEEHRAHIEHIRQVHDFDKIISGIHDRTRKIRKEADEATTKREAEEIFERFKSGEKLSTEDIMILQKSGYM